ncbi:hypothetical protein B9Z19DRAFT_1196528 [Tuber borchii]|uniref:Uncharacterized protein n=1 Tax=Tuber borchii TaxID=42251 RepID=A0A2T6ZEU1_TUBBO|nr:hypothetical protein B9Z19DRAFT_1196528 [Tuber borchii]
MFLELLLLRLQSLEAYNSYHQLEAKAKGVILGSTSPAFRLYLTGMTTAKEMWNTLKNHLDKAASINGRLALRRQLLSASPLAGSEQRIDDTSFKDKLLSSLPTSYNNLMEIIHEREAELSVEDVIRKVQQSEIAKEMEVKSTNTSLATGSALITTSRNDFAHRRFVPVRSRNMNCYSPYNNPSSHFNGICFHYKEKGHQASMCPHSLPGSRFNTSHIGYMKNNGNKPTSTCFAYGEVRHRSQDCHYTSLTQDQAVRDRNTLLTWRTSTIHKTGQDTTTSQANLAIQGQSNAINPSASMSSDQSLLHSSHPNGF